MRLRPVQLPLTEKVASIYPSRGQKKNCTPRLACSSVSACGSVGLPNTSGCAPACVPVKVREAVLTSKLELTVFPELGLSGVLKYSYSCTVICSTSLPSGLVSRSKTVMDAGALLGRMMISSALAHE